MQNSAWSYKKHIEKYEMERNIVNIWFYLQPFDSNANSDIFPLAKINFKKMKYQ